MPVEEHPHQTAVIGRRSRCKSHRAGLTLTDLIIVMLVAIIGGIVAMPWLYQGVQRAIRTGCAFNLRTIGLAITGYSDSHGGRLPIGSGYQSQPASPWGTSWWVDILPHVGTHESFNRWQSTPNSGSFSQPAANPNLAQVDGLRPSVMTCPASPLPMFNNPRRHYSEANRTQPGEHRGLLVPSYVAIAGSTPDRRNLPANYSGGPSGRNTRESSLGILSGSGAFPPNRLVAMPALRDGQQFTMLVSEQSDWLYDRQFEPPILYDTRSAWPEGAYTGCGAPYGELNPNAADATGSGEARCYNITSIRYPINHRLLVNGVLGEPTTPVPARPAMPPPGETLAGPGHNAGLYSAHGGGVNVLFADGHVRFLSDDTDLDILLRLATRDDNLFVELPR